MVGFLLIAGLTGALLAWYDKLEEWVNEGLHRVQPPSANAYLLDPLILRERLLAQYPQVTINYIPLKFEADTTVRLFVDPKPDSISGETVELIDDEWFVNPYTAEIQGQRDWGNISQGVKNIMPFIFRLHYTLALGIIGRYAFGIIALLWTIDCFIGAYLTFPRRMRRLRLSGQKNVWQRWQPAWKVRWLSSSYKVNFDLHSAGGLWPWAMLLVLAWSGVAFNLSEVYKPVMGAMFEFQPSTRDLPRLKEPELTPTIGWSEARDIGRRLISEQGQLQGFSVDYERRLTYSPKTGSYRYDVRSSRDISDHKGSTRLAFNAKTGELIGLWLPTGAATGDTIRSWLVNIHMASFWGWPFKLFICLVGLAVAMLSVTGVIIWWRKRSARRRVSQKISSKDDKPRSAVTATQN
jgi:uncharacterized iron-regulated membrane protein